MSITIDKVCVFFYDDLKITNSDKEWKTIEINRPFMMIFPHSEELSKPLEFIEKYSWVALSDKEDNYMILWLNLLNDLSKVNTESIPILNDPLGDLWNKARHEKDINKDIEIFDNNASIFHRKVSEKYNKWIECDIKIEIKDNKATVSIKNNIDIKPIEKDVKTAECALCKTPLFTQNLVIAKYSIPFSCKYANCKKGHCYCEEEIEKKNIKRIDYMYESIKHMDLNGSYLACPICNKDIDMTPVVLREYRDNKYCKVKSIKEMFEEWEKGCNVMLAKESAEYPKLPNRLIYMQYDCEEEGGFDCKITHNDKKEWRIYEEDGNDDHSYEHYHWTQMEVKDIPKWLIDLMEKEGYKNMNDDL